MLDQNTDRMWFVIGAVIVGAAIIFIANGTIPEIFASVTDSFEGASNSALAVIEDIDGEYFSDKVPLYAMEPNVHGEWDFSNYESHGYFDVTSNIGYGGVRFFPSKLDIQPNTTYVMEYSFQKIAGVQQVVGNHAHETYANNVVFIDGRQMPQRFLSGNEAVLFEDSNEKYDVKAYIHIGDSINPQDHIVFQPNRGIATYLSLRISDLTWREATESELLDVELED